MFVYKDGKLEAQKLGISSFKQGDYDLYVGCGKFPFNGDIREFRIWNGSSSQIAIQEDMGKILNGNEPGLFAYHRGQAPKL